MSRHVTAVQLYLICNLPLPSVTSLEETELGRLTMV